MSGGRGLDTLALLTERAAAPSTTDPLTIEAVLDVFPSDTQIARRIAPSARVTSVSSNTATVQGARYTRSTTDSPVDDLPTTDASAFAVGDVVQLKTPAGVKLASGSTQTITATSGNTITLDGNFGGALATATVITTAPYDDATATQQARCGYQAGDDLRIGTGDAPATLYGDE